MLKTIRANSYFFSGMLFFVITGAILLLLIEQGDLIRYFSSNRSAPGDFFFKYFTKVGEEGAYVLIFLLLLFVRFRYSMLVILTAFITLAISLISKSYFAHPRPHPYFFYTTRELDQINLIDGVELLVGSTSFPSGHSMSAFALYGLLALLWKNKKVFGIACFLTAFFIALSRVYLVQHFLKDIYVGSLIGLSIAIILYHIQLLIPHNKWLDGSLLGVKQPKPIAAKSVASEP